MTNLEILTKRIHKLVPDLAYDSGEPVGGGYIQYRKAGLAGVLRAIHQLRQNATGTTDPYAYTVSIDGTLMKQGYHFQYQPSAIRWNLADDDLSKQNDECIEFLLEVIPE